MWLVVRGQVAAGCDVRCCDVMKFCNAVVDAISLGVRYCVSR